jgi:hypothetical protein
MCRIFACEGLTVSLSLFIVTANGTRLRAILRVYPPDSYTVFPEQVSGFADDLRLKKCFWTEKIKRKKMKS